MDNALGLVGECFTFMGVMCQRSEVTHVRPLRTWEMELFNIPGTSRSCL